MTNPFGQKYPDLDVKPVEKSQDKRKIGLMSANKKKTKVRPKKKATHRSPSKRAYDNTTRSEKSLLTQQKIIKTLVSFLVKRKGGEVQFEEIAVKLGISERTIFRFFKDKETLHKAVDQYLMTYMKASMHQLDTLDFVGFAKNSFLLFDRNESLVLAYLFSGFGNQTRQIFRKKLTSVMIERIVQQKKLNLTPELQKRLAFMTTMVNAKIWYDLKSDFGFSGEDMGPTLEWAMKLLLNHL